MLVERHAHRAHIHCRQRNVDGTRLCQRRGRTARRERFGAIVNALSRRRHVISFVSIVFLLVFCLIVCVLVFIVVFICDCFENKGM